jgi:hypothetical protein
MQIRTEEKKHALCVLGTECAACRVLYPVLEGKEKISAFYAEMCENLLSFFRGEAQKKAEAFKALPRREKRGFASLRMNMFFTVTYTDEKIISISREYALREGSHLLCYRKSGEIWCAECEILLPAQQFFPHKMWKIAEKNEFYFDGEAVLVENFFPEAVSGDGKRARLCDYVRETRFGNEK